ncbi:hypothetical protein EW145_g7182 [Phellinidium pouzarii]|uniref:Uncharacterized protein n=1 Tax=Phellinidium pouzarii TaxID=167371 RepID=A0A4S4KMU5_9AGAM|nr:hypothetical protein EW145_g7182 [Phellinidium pouzarii]
MTTDIELTDLAEKRRQAQEDTQSEQPTHPTEYSERALTPLESFLATHLSFFLLALAITLVLYIPSEEPFEPSRRRDYLGHPLLGPLTGAALLSSFVSYNTSSISSLSFTASIFTGIIGLWGLWVILFEGTSRISKKTGADKHTSAFLFGNKKAASSQKKEWKRAQKSS